MAKRRGTRIDSIAAMDMETFKPMFGFGRQHFGAIAKAMGVRFNSVFSKTFIGPLPATNAETIVFTTGPLVLPIDGTPVLVLWSVALFTGASTTSHGFNLRLGTTIAAASILGGTWQQNSTAATFAIFNGGSVHLPGAGSGLQYTLTIQQTAATGAGVFNDGWLFAFAL